jgi:hypothetical protein
MEETMSGIDLAPDQPCYEARVLGCTCTWLRGFSVGETLEEWVEQIIWRDPECLVNHEEAFSNVTGDQGA